MKKVLLSALMLLFASACFAKEIMVPAGTVVPFQYDIGVSSKKIKPDDQIPITVVRDVIVSNEIIFQRGAKGYLTVFDVYKVRTWHITEYKKGGFVDIEGGQIQDVTGNMRNIDYKEYQKGKDLGPSYSSYSYGQANINMNNYNYSNPTVNANSFSTMHENRLTGDNVTIPKGTRAKAIISNDFKLDIQE